MKNPIHAFSPLRASCRARGFTLIELLVSIVIVAVIAGLVFTVSSRALDKAAQVEAVASLRQVVSANLAFTAENHGNINTLRWDGDPKEGRPFVGNSFWGRVQPYLFTGATSTNQKNLKREIKQELDQIFNTPDSDKMRKTILDGAPVYHDASGLPVPIGFNRNLYEWNKDVKITRFADVSNVIYAAYGFGFFNERDGRSATEMPKAGTKPESNLYYLDNGRALVSFLDGRVEFLAPPIRARRFE